MISYVLRRRMVSKDYLVFLDWLIANYEKLNLYNVGAYPRDGVGQRIQLYGLQRARERWAATPSLDVHVGFEFDRTTEGEELLAYVKLRFG